MFGNTTQGRGVSESAGSPHSFKELNQIACIRLYQASHDAFLATRPCG
jgi:hypothetical protein